MNWQSKIMHKSRFGIATLIKNQQREPRGKLAPIDTPKLTPHWIHLQQRTEEEMGLLQWRHNMYMWEGHQQHGTHVTIWSLVASLHLG